MAIAVNRNMKIAQMDVISAFLPGELSEEIFMEQPEGFDDGSGRVCRLLRTIYTWNIKLDATLRGYGLLKSTQDPCIYYSADKSIIILYSDVGELKKLKQRIENFSMKDLGLAKSCLGMRIEQSDYGIDVDQSQYISIILTRFGMKNCKPIGTPMDTNTKLSASMVNDDNNLTGKISFQEAIGSLFAFDTRDTPGHCICNQLFRSIQWQSL